MYSTQTGTGTVKQNTDTHLMDIVLSNKIVNGGQSYICAPFHLIHE